MPKRFRSAFSFEQRFQVSKRILDKYPGYIPVVVEKMDKSDIPELEKKKFLVPIETTMQKFVLEIRKQLSIRDSQALFLFVQNRLVPNSQTILEVSKRYTDPDGFVYIDYGGENTFG